MSESNTPEGDESIYDASVRLGAEAIARRTGKSVEQVLREEREASLRRHAEALKTSNLKPEEIEQSASNWQKAFNKLLSTLQKLKKRP